MLKNNIKYYFDFHKSIIFKLTKKIPTVDLHELFPGIQDTIIDLRLPLLSYGNAGFYEIQVLSAVAKFLKIKTFFEIGSYNGVTSSNIYLNSGANVYTLDLPNKESIKTTKYQVESEMNSIISAEKFYNLLLPSNHKVTQLWGDSAIFDYSPYHSMVDMIFIDGSHTYEYADSDTQSSFKMLRKNGVVFWHDYNFYFQGVQKVLHSLQKEKKLYNISGTSLVVYKD